MSLNFDFFFYVADVWIGLCEFSELLVLIKTFYKFLQELNVYNIVFVKIPVTF